MYYQSDIDNVEKAIEALTGMIFWDSTQDGSDYWDDVRERMYRIKASIEQHLSPKVPELL